MIRPFKLDFPDSSLADLRHRLENVRWPDEVVGAGWDYGVPVSTLRELVDYWRDGFDWRVQEASLNRLPHFLTTISGLDIHFIHQRGVGPRPMPIVISHGWPSCFVEMCELIPRLADPGRFGGDPADAFDVVVPSLPGIGFSQAATTPGMTKTRIAAIWTQLMVQELGYPRFAARGGDIGSGICAFLGVDQAPHVIGIHVSDVIKPYLGAGAQALTEAEIRFLDSESAWMNAEGGYDHIQATKPQTLGYGLSDSPVGMAAWIIEKLRGWSDGGGSLYGRFSRDEILTILTIYWCTNTINSANRLYFEREREGRRLGRGEKVLVPCAVALFPADIDLPPREYGERSYRLERWTLMPRGGHFAAHEEPDLLAEDMRAFFRPLRPE